MSDEARNQQRTIMNQFQRVGRYRDGSRPQLGWDQRTGTPVFSVRATARNSYTALSGPDQQYVECLHQQWRNIFRLEYIRVQRGGQTVYTLAWPEFVDNQHARHQDPSTRDALRELCTFLQWWVSRVNHLGDLRPIDQEWNRWVRSRESPPAVLTMPWPPSASIADQQALPRRSANQQHHSTINAAPANSKQPSARTPTWEEKVLGYKRRRSDDEEEDGRGGGGHRRTRIE